MASVATTSYVVNNDVVSIATLSPHGLSQGDYISVRNIASGINGEYFILSVPTSTSLTYSVTGVANIGATSAIGGYILSTSFNNTGKPAYIYNESTDTWFQISGKVNTNANYTWTGTHLHQVPVTMEDILILKNVSASVSASVSGGGYLFVQNGELKFKGGNGTITTIAPA